MADKVWDVLFRSVEAVKIQLLPMLVCNSALVSLPDLFGRMSAQEIQPAVVVVPAEVIMTS